MINGLFDFQKFQKNEKLDSVIQESLKSAGVDELGLDDLELVTAGLFVPTTIKKVGEKGLESATNPENPTLRV